VVDVDVDVVATPAAAVAVAAVPPRGADGDADAEGDHAGGNDGTSRVGRIVDRWVRVDRRSVDDDRAVGGNVDDLRVRRLNDDDRLLLDDLRLDRLLLARVERPGPRGLLAHSLDGVHDVALLSKELVTEPGGPLDVVPKTLDGVWQGRHRLDAGVPGLL